MTSTPTPTHPTATDRTTPRAMPTRSQDGPGVGAVGTREAERPAPAGQRGLSRVRSGLHSVTRGLGRRRARPANPRTHSARLHPSAAPVDPALPCYPETDDQDVPATPAAAAPVRRTRFDRGLDALDAFVAREGHARVPQRHREPQGPLEDAFFLGSFVADQRQAFRRGDLSLAAIDQLSRRDGWVWDTRPYRFATSVAALDAFVAREGHTWPPSGHQEDGVALASWCATVRKTYATGALPEGQRDVLETIGLWRWTAPSAQFRKGLAAFDAFTAREGHACVRHAAVEGGFPLGSWVARQRSVAAHTGLDMDRVFDLEERPLWTWSAEEATHARALAAFDAFVAREGHGSVGRGHIEAGVALDTWCRTRRSEYASGTLAPVIERELAWRPAWSWDLRADRFQAGLDALNAFVAREHHAAVPATHTEDGYSLGCWVARQRRIYRQGQLSAARISVLEGHPGWAWSRSVRTQTPRGSR